MTSDFAPVFAILFFLGAVIITIRILVQWRVWKRLIDKNMVNENMDLPSLSTFQYNNVSWLKWGIVITAFGMAIVLNSLLPIDDYEGLQFGITGIFIGVAFIISYYISGSIENKDSE